MDKTVNYKSGIHCISPIVYEKYPFLGARAQTLQKMGYYYTRFPRYHWFYPPRGVLMLP